MTTQAREIITDFVSLAEAEIEGIRTGKSRGLRMRDCLGQWQATVRQAKEFLSQMEGAQ